MRKRISEAFVALGVFLSLVMAVPALAGMGGGYGVADGTGPMVNLFEGTPVTVSGTVAGLPAPGDPGLKVDTGTEVVTVYGIGPSWIWEKMGVAYPTVGEAVTVEGYEISLTDGTTRIVAYKVNVSGQEIVLRGDDGRPVWRGGQGRGMNR